MRPYTVADLKYQVLDDLFEMEEERDEQAIGKQAERAKNDAETERG